MSNSHQNRVFVIDTNRNQCAPCTPARARLLLKRGKASVLRLSPFTIILHHIVKNPRTTNLVVQLDPGTRTSGISLLIKKRNSKMVVIWAANLIHRQAEISAKLLGRSQTRRARRSRNLRYRQARFDNRTKPKGWIPPSVQSVLENYITWFARLAKFTGVTYCRYETTTFDMAKMNNPDIQGKEYQQGTLQGYMLKEYLLYRYNHTCQYCHGLSGDNMLETEHIVPKSNNGSNSINNLTLACHTCNQSKSNIPLLVWSQSLPNTIYGKKVKINALKVSKGIKPKLKGATLLNIILSKMDILLHRLGYATSKHKAYETKYSRMKHKYPKDHWIDASVVGDVNLVVTIPNNHQPLIIKSTKINNRQMCLSNKYGFPRTKAKKASSVNGYSSGDICKINNTSVIGKIAIRATGWCAFKSKNLNKDIHICNLNKIQNSAGYKYIFL